jgi:lipopolysaccharide export LptBFGC system permease protein LptF
MKKIIYLLILTVSGIFRTNAQETGKAPEYKVPTAYNFDYKVVYEINREENKTPETMSYYFTKSGDFMSMETPDSQKNKDMNFMISTKDGLMITFGEEHVPKSQDKYRKVLKVMDMHSMMKGSAESMAALAKAMPKKDKPNTDNKKANELDNLLRQEEPNNSLGTLLKSIRRNSLKKKMGKCIPVQ